MVSRTTNPLRFTAGVAAALSMMGVGATALRGTVFDFHAWPQAGGSNMSYVELAAAETTSPAGSPAFFAGGSAGVAARLTGGIVVVQEVERTEAPAAVDTPGAQAADGGPGANDGAAQFDAGTGSSGTGSDQGSAPATTTPEAVGVPVGVDTTGDGVTDTWRQSAPILDDGPKSESPSGPDSTTTIFSVEPPKVLASPPTPAADPEPVVEEPPAPEPVVDPPVVDPPAPDPVVDPPAPEPEPVVDPPAPPVEEPPVVEEAPPVEEAPVVEEPPAVETPAAEVPADA